MTQPTAERKGAGFTLVELLVVIAVIAILASLLLPALGRAKAKGQQIACLSNYRQLQVCWQMYAEDNEDGLPANAAFNSGAGTREAWIVGRPSWLLGNAWTDTTDANIRAGVLFKYDQSVGIYRCPGDRSTVRDEGKLPRTRSVSMSMYMNLEPDPRESEYRRCWHRLAQIANPSPSKALVFVDENEKSIQQSAFGINAPARWLLFGTPLWTWISFPATRHNQGCTLTFADGHGETWRWPEGNTKRISALNVWTVLQRAVPDADRDLGRLFQAIPAQVPIR